MKNLFKTNSDALLKALKKVGKVKNSTTLPILNNIYFKHESGLLTIRRTDIETDIITTMDVSLDIDSENYEFLLNAELIDKGLATLKNQEITFFLNEKTFTIIVKYATGTFELGLYDLKEFPKLTNDEFDNQFVIGTDKLQKALLLSANFSGNDELRPIMKGLFIEYKADIKKLRFVSTDAHILFRIEHDIDYNKDFSLVVSKNSFSAILNLIEKGIDNVIISFNQSFVKFNFGSSTLYSRLVDGKYPDYNSILPKTFVATLKLNKGDLKNTLNRLNWIVAKNTKKITIDMSKEKLIFSAEDIDYAKSGTEITPFIMFNGDPLKRNFNLTLLQSCIKDFEGDIVTINFADGLKPCIINSDYTPENIFLLMPLI